MIVALRVLIVLMLACLPARAEEEMEFDVDIDTRFVCDTQTQVGRGSSRCKRAMLLRPCPRRMASRKIRRLRCCEHRLRPPVMKCRQRNACRRQRVERR